MFCAATVVSMPPGALESAAKWHHYEVVLGVVYIQCRRKHFLTAKVEVQQTTLSYVRFTFQMLTFTIFWRTRIFTVLVLMSASLCVICNESSDRGLLGSGQQRQNTSQELIGWLLWAKRKNKTKYLLCLLSISRSKSSSHSPTASLYISIYLLLVSSLY